MHAMHPSQIPVFFTSRTLRLVWSPKVQNNAMSSQIHSLSQQPRLISPAGKRRRSDIDTEGSAEAVELFSLDSGWNVEALNGIGAGDLQDIGEWTVDSLSEDVISDEEDELNTDTYEKSDFDADIESGDGFDGVASGSSNPAGVSRAQSSSSHKRGSAEEQLLRSLPKHVARQLMAHQAEAELERARLKPSTRRRESARQKTHRRLRIISGSAAGRRILSPQGDQTRPMMELVRGAVFSMIASLHGSAATGGLPERGRWLDLFAGTGAVGIEALSRGCEQAHFVELSPWVISNCLRPNLEYCEVEGAAVVHGGRVEDFLRRAVDVPRFGGGSFDFVSVCPPYEMVSYTEVLRLLEEGPFLKESSVVLVEYPRRVADEIPERLGPLVKLRDRRYGRTLVALFGPE